MKREPVLIVMSVLAALQILTAGAALGDVIGAQLAALLVLAVAAAQSGVQFYVRGAVTPNQAVAAKVDEAREGVVGGEAAPADLEGEAVEVVELADE